MSLKILVAEDDATSRQMLVAILKKYKHDVIAVENGLEAWDIMQEPDPPRLVILDWVMPELDGVTLCKNIRREPSMDPPYIIMLTMRAEHDDIVRALDAGANDYILKPYNIRELHARVRVGERVLTLQQDLNETRAALLQEAMHDPLTGALNRRAILDTLRRELARAKRENSPLSVAICDIDHFKNINDTLGHLAGDDALCGFWSRLKDNLREYEYVGRYGGEEFLILLSPMCEESAQTVFERLRAQIEAAPFVTREGELSITASFGVSCRSEKSSVDSLLAEADSAMYLAKEAGRNRVAFASQNT